jgi:hypothetical protein
LPAITYSLVPDPSSNVGKFVILTRKLEGEIINNIKTKQDAIEKKFQDFIKKPIDKPNLKKIKLGTTECYFNGSLDKSDKPVGFGTLYLDKDGKKIVYKGRFLNGKYHGYGIEYGKDGKKKHKGYWESGKINGIEKRYDDNGKLVFQGYNKGYYIAYDNSTKNEYYLYFTSDSKDDFVGIEKDAKKNEIHSVEGKITDKGKIVIKKRYNISGSYPSPQSFNVDGYEYDKAANLENMSYITDDKANMNVVFVNNTDNTRAATLIGPKSNDINDATNTITGVVVYGNGD